MKCGKCKVEGTTVEHVRQCYGRPAVASKREQHNTKRSNLMSDVRALGDECPEGRFAVLGEDGTVDFYKVDKPTEGRWKGYTFLTLQRSDDYVRLPMNTQVAVYTKILANPKEAMLRYGREIGSCGHCGRTLTNEESRKVGIGPVCRARMGW